jgi:cell division protein FtsL
MTRRARPANPPSALAAGILMVAVAALGFTTLMIRLETTREGYRLSALREDIARLEDQNRTLRLKAAELSSHERLRALAPRYHLAAPANGQVVMIP